MDNADKKEFDKNMRIIYNALIPSALAAKHYQERKDALRKENMHIKDDA